MPNYTLTFSETSKGWPSFYSYYPDFMIGMNNYFYSFKGGNIWRHNTNDTRNNFYGVQYNSIMTSVINQNPLENKLFKTIHLESDAAWSGTFISDQQTTGFIDSSYFEQKEGDWFAFIRNSGATPANPDEYALRSLNGLANSISIDTTTPTAVIVNFPLTQTNQNTGAVSVLDIDSILSTGDSLYNATIPVVNATPTYIGVVTSVEVDLPNNINRIIVDTTAPGSLPVGAVNFYLFIKNQVAESHGILGHFMEFTITNTDTTPTELFAVESEVMKSFP